MKNTLKNIFKNILKNKLILALILALAPLGFVRAEDAGCGLGSLIIQRNSKILQLLAVTTNATFFSQTLGITSGTSNCSASGLVMNDKAIEYFAEANQKDLSREMAQGEGEKLRTLASLHGCSTQGQQDFASLAQRSYARILPKPDTTAFDMVQNLKAELQSDPVVAKECSNIASR